MMGSLLQFILKEPRALNAIASNGAKALSIPVRHYFRRRLHHHSSAAQPPSFGIAFDIDGVLLRGETPIGGSPQALSRLYEDSGSAASSALKIPYVFLTNGGGVPESKRAKDLAGQLGVNISPLQGRQGHTPSKQLVKRFENDLIVAVGKGKGRTIKVFGGVPLVIGGVLPELYLGKSCFRFITAWEDLAMIERVLALPLEHMTLRKLKNISKDAVELA